MRITSTSISNSARTNLSCRRIGIGKRLPIGRQLHGCVGYGDQVLFGLTCLLGVLLGTGLTRLVLVAQQRFQQVRAGDDYFVARKDPFQHFDATRIDPSFAGSISEISRLRPNAVNTES